MTEPRRAAVIGTGLIGGSIGLALRARGWHVSGTDADPSHAERALSLGAIDAIGEDPEAEVTFVATPVSAVVPAALKALAASEIAEAAENAQVADLAGRGAPGVAELAGREEAGAAGAAGARPRRVVTDVTGVKGPVTAAITHPRFVGGHPMAGSEQEGVDGADPDLFAGATWVLTPTSTTSPEAFAQLRTIVSSLGADVIALAPDNHDVLVALVSHVPHLTAATLMGLAANGAAEQGALLRLAAGGFRDMTRVAAGHPGIWPDICAENRDAIVATLDELVASLSEVREMVASGNQAELLARLSRARLARRELPSPVSGTEELVEVRVPVADRPGALAEVTTLAGGLGVNIDDLVLTHSSEGDRGVLILVIDAHSVDRVRQGLLDAGLHPSSVRRLD
ncbi:MAG: prephenate dehydrogenase/arogenate dehydrogenase family protein [Acidimicrobiales bacterium]